MKKLFLFLLLTTSVYAESEKPISHKIFDFRSELNVGVICVDGYKFVFARESHIEAGSLVQFYEVTDGKTQPAKCNANK